VSRREDKRCKRCGCVRDNYVESDECINRGWCELMASRRADATEEDQLIVDAIAELGRLDDERKAREAVRS
jgi:hypothetical protein